MLTISAACDVVADRTGRKVATQTMRSWTWRGLRRHGETIKLRARRVGGVYVIDPADLEAFLAATA